MMVTANPQDIDKELVKEIVDELAIYSQTFINKVGKLINKHNEHPVEISESITGMFTGLLSILAHDKAKNVAIVIAYRLMQREAEHYDDIKQAGKDMKSHAKNFKENNKPDYMG